MACITTSILNDASEAMCKQKGRAGAEKWANLVSPRCVMADLPGKHVERLATVSHARMRRLLHPRRRLQAPTDPRSTMKALACSRPGARRKVRCASHLRVESSPRHTQRVSAGPAIRTVAISIVHQRSSPETPKNGAHDRTGAATGVSWTSAGWPETRFRPCIQIGGGPAQSAGRRFKVQRNPRAFGFCFLVCYAATQQATQLQQRCIQVCSNKEARKRLTESNGTPAMDFGPMNRIHWHLHIVLKFVGSGLESQNDSNYKN